MKAPDKIYIDDNVFPTHIDWDGSPINTKRIESSDIKYIRKDALLEWIKKEMKNWSSESNTAQGVKMGLTLVLDKIELL